MQMRAIKVKLNNDWTQQMVAGANHAQAADSSAPLDGACSIVSIALPGGSKITTILDLAAGQTLSNIAADATAQGSEAVPSCSSLSDHQYPLPVPCRVSSSSLANAGEVHAAAAVWPYTRPSFVWQGQIAGEAEDSLVTLAAARDDEGNLEWAGSVRSSQHGVFTLSVDLDQRDRYFMIELDESRVTAEPLQYEPPPPTRAANSVATAGEAGPAEEAGPGRRLLLDRPPRPSNELDPVGG